MVNWEATMKKTNRDGLLMTTAVGVYSQELLRGHFFFLNFELWIAYYFPTLYALLWS